MRISDWSSDVCSTDLAGCEALGTKVMEHIAVYGNDIEDRLTGQHETAPYNEYSYGVSNRGASVRIPWQVEVDKKGYIEDRRPNANCDPYEVTQIIVDTICSVALWSQQSCQPALVRAPPPSSAGTCRFRHRSRVGQIGQAYGRERG